MASATPRKGGAGGAASVTVATPASTASSALLHRAMMGPGVVKNVVSSTEWVDWRQPSRR